MASYHGDPVSGAFDRGMAFLGYGLLAASVFMAWIPAVVAAVIAFAHRRDAHPVAVSHFRFQLLVFWWGSCWSRCRSAPS